MPAFAENRKAYFDYEILETFEAGLSLSGPEVKSVRLGGVELPGSYVIFRGSSAFLKGAHIHPYQVNNPSAKIVEYRDIALLLKRKELERLIGAESQRGLTIVPIKLYGNKGRIKAEIALVKRKKSHDKRATIKKRDAERDMRRTMKYE